MSKFGCHHYMMTMHQRNMGVTIQKLLAFGFQCSSQLSMLCLQAGSHIQFDRLHFGLGYHLSKLAVTRK